MHTSQTETVAPAPAYRWGGTNGNSRNRAHVYPLEGGRMRGGQALCGFRPAKPAHPQTYISQYCPRCAAALKAVPA